MFIHTVQAGESLFAISEPGPVAPINEVRRTIQFAIGRVPSRKIILGVPLYEYNWVLPYRQKI